MSPAQLRAQAGAAGLPGPAFDRACALWQSFDPGESPTAVALAVRNHAVSGRDTPVLRVARAASDGPDAVRRWRSGERGGTPAG